MVECSPATRAARVRFPDDAEHYFSIMQLNTFVLLPFKLVQEKTNKTFFFRDKKGLVINQRFAELVQFPMSKLSDFFTQSRYFFFRKLRIIEVFSEYNIHNTTSSIRIPFFVE